LSEERREREVFGEEKVHKLGEGAPLERRAHAWRGRTMRLGRTKLEKGHT